MSNLLSDVAWASKYAGGHVPVMELIRVKIKDGKYFLALSSAEASFTSKGETDLKDIEFCVDAKQFAKIVNIKKMTLDGNRLNVDTGSSKISFTVSPGGDIPWPQLPDLDYPSIKITPEIMSKVKELAVYGDPTNQGVFGAVWFMGHDILSFSPGYCAYRKGEVFQEISLPIYIIKELKSDCSCFSTDRGVKVVYDENHKILFNTTDRGKQGPKQPLNYLEAFKGVIEADMSPEIISSFLEAMSVVNPSDASGKSPIKFYENQIHGSNMYGQDFVIDVKFSGDQAEPYYVSGKLLSMALSNYKDGCKLEMNKEATLITSGIQKRNIIANIQY